ncbi:MAG: hypothetical protein H0V17_18275, partial [Deltaproteobacteria bacterium]|nr:hypothetical protein [Deltaproteobacteria bacterium]
GCARTANNEVHCWGDRTRRNQPQSINAPPPPKTIVLGRDVSQLDANGPMLCMLRRGEVDCSGGDVQIWIDDGVRGGTPVVSLKDASFVQVVVGWAHACGRRRNGTIGCWGYNHGGQLGSGPPLDDKPRETVVPVKLASAIDVAARENTTCAVLRNGTVSCWGTNRDGQVGNGTFGNVYTVGAPVEAP